MKNGIFLVLVSVLSVAVGWLGHSYFSGEQSTENFSALKKREESSNRGPANVSEFVQSESLRLDRLLTSIDSKEKLKQVLNTIIQDDKNQNWKDGNWDPTNPTLRLYGMAADSFLKFEGIAYRLRDVVEIVMPAYLSAISTLRGTKYYLSHLPKHVEVGFDFLVDPNPDTVIYGHKGKFKSYGQLRSYLKKNIEPEMIALAEQLTFLADQYSDEIIWNTNIEAVFGAAKAQKIFNHAKNRGGEDHFRKGLLGSHLNMAAASIYQALGVGTYILSFEIDGVQDFINTMITQSYTAAQARENRVIGWITKGVIPSPREVKKTLNKVRSKQASFLRLTDEARQDNSLQDAKNYLIEAVKLDQKYHLDIFEQARTLSNPSAYLINPKLIAPEEHHIMNVINTRLELLTSQGPIDLEIPVTGEKIRINVSVAFDSSRFSDLIAFYPVCFYGDKVSSACPANGKNLSRVGQTDPKQEIDDSQFIGRVFQNDDFKWNYLYGRPELWPSPSFHGLFPEANQKTIVEHIAKFSSTPYLPTLGAFLNLYR